VLDIINSPIMKRAATANRSTSTRREKALESSPSSRNPKKRKASQNDDDDDARIIKPRSKSKTIGKNTDMVKPKSRKSRIIDSDDEEEEFQEPIIDVDNDDDDDDDDDGEDNGAPAGSKERQISDKILKEITLQRLRMKKALVRFQFMMRSCLLLLR
jgi:hypothetical protein